MSQKRLNGMAQIATERWIPYFLHIEKIGGNTCSTKNKKNKKLIWVI
jgi:hypothetical protein